MLNGAKIDEFLLIYFFKKKSMIPVRYHNKEKKKRKKTNTGILKSEMLVSVEVLLSKMPRGHFTLCKSTSAYITKLVRGF